MPQTWLMRFQTVGMTRGCCCCWQVANSQDTLLVPRVVDVAAKLLFDMGQLPTNKPEPVPDDHALVPRALKVDEIEKLLTVEGGCRMVLLHGMPGSGKSTLAKVVFNKFHAQDPTTPCCYVNLKGEHGELPAAMQRIREQLVFATAEEKQEALANPLEVGWKELAGGRLRNTRVLLVVDNVWRDQLELLLPTKGSKGISSSSSSSSSSNISVSSTTSSSSSSTSRSTSRSTSSFMELLGEGSMVLVTSCDRTAADSFGEGCALVEVDRLSDEEAWRMWCGLQYDNGISPCSPEEDVAVKRVLAHCGGLPLAIEALSRHLKNTAPCDFLDLDARESAHVAYKVRRSDSDSDAQAGVLGAIGSCHKRTRDWEDDLLDVVWFFKGRSWAVVERYCTHGALERLEQVGLVKKRRAAAGSGVRVEVHPSVEDFCHTDLHQKYCRLFTELHPDDAADLVRPTWVFLLHSRCLWPLTALLRLLGHIAWHLQQRLMHSRAGGLPKACPACRMLPARVCR
jgi:hypothetical protein